MTSAADLILAGPNDSSAIVASDYPLASFKGVNVDGLDPLKLGALHSLLAQKPLQDILREYQPMAQASPSGPWLIRLPSELVELLGNIAPPDQAGVAAKWAATNLAQEESWSDQDADGFLGRLVPFAQTAAFEKMELFLWVYS